MHCLTLASPVTPPPDHSNLAQNALTGPLPPQWSSLSSLASLDASSNYLSGPLPDAWRGMDSLQELHLANNNLGVRGGPQLWCLPIGRFWFLGVAAAACHCAARH